MLDFPRTAPVHFASAGIVCSRVKRARRAEGGGGVLVLWRQAGDGPEDRSADAGTSIALLCLVFTPAACEHERPGRPAQF